MLKIICLISIIVYFLFWWTYIPKDVSAHKKRGEIILNEDKYIKTLKKAIISESFIYGIIVIVVIYVLRNLSIIQTILIITGYGIIKMIIHYKIDKKYICKKRL